MTGIHVRNGRQLFGIFRLYGGISPRHGRRARSAFHVERSIHVERHRSASRETFFGFMAAFRPDMVDSCSAFPPDMAAFSLEMVDSCSAFFGFMASFRPDMVDSCLVFHMKRYGFT